MPFSAPSDRKAKSAERRGTSRPDAACRLTIDEIRAAFEPLQDRFPPILNLEQAAELSHYAPDTLKKKFSQGEFADCVSRGKPVQIWRDRFVQQVMNRPLPKRRPRRLEEVTANPQKQVGFVL